MPEAGPPALRKRQGSPRRGLLGALGGVIVLRFHRLADRLDRLPAEFGAQGAVDAADSTAVLAEWLRCLQCWADFNSEQIFALKVGGAMLIAGILAMWLAIALLL